VVDRIVDNVVDRVAVLLLGFDHLRPEAPAEDVIAAAVALVEGAGVLAVQVAHAVGEVCAQGLDDQVVVVPHQAANVETPVVPAHHAVEDLDEDDAIPVVQDDRRLVVAACGDVVEGSGGKVTMRASHPLRR